MEHKKLGLPPKALYALERCFVKWVSTWKKIKIREKEKYTMVAPSEKVRQAKFCLSHVNSGRHTANKSVFALVLACQSSRKPRFPQHRNFLLSPKGHQLHQTGNVD